MFEPRANFGVSDEMIAMLREARIGIGDGPVGTCASTRAPVQVADVEASEYGGRKIWLHDGIRAVVAVPLLRESAPPARWRSAGTAPANFRRPR